MKLHWSARLNCYVRIYGDDRGAPYQVELRVHSHATANSLARRMKQLSATQIRTVDWRSGFYGGTSFSALGSFSSFENALKIAEQYIQITCASRTFYQKNNFVVVFSPGFGTSVEVQERKPLGL
jgi:hypothetical protein